MNKVLNSRLLHIKYLSFGKYKTGGYRHEDFFTDTLCNFLKQHGHAVNCRKKRPERFFEGFFAHIQLLLWGFAEAEADYNIVVGRLGLSATVRNMLSKSKVLIVLHNYDNKDKKSFGLRLYYGLLFAGIKYLRPGYVSIITVAPYWQHYFQNRLGKKAKVCLFPNFFDIDFYRQFRSTFKAKRIHLGQWNSKNHPDVFKIAEKLFSEGYDCYFSTNDKDAEKEHNFYRVVYDSFENYLHYMAQSEYTLAITGIKEGWNRMAHESILVGTPVIGYAKAGLGELLHQSKSLVAKDPATVVQHVLLKHKPETPESFFFNYAASSAKVYLEKILNN